LVHRSSVLTSTVAVVLAFTFSLAAPLAAKGAGNAAGNVAVSRIQIDNFGQISSTYYRGAQPEGRDYADLAAIGVKTIINLTSDDGQASEESQVARAGMKYVHIPMTTRAVPTTAQLAEFLQIVNDPAEQPVYVHCVGGKHRTGVMTAIYRMSNEGWSADKAFAEMKDYKFCFDFLHPEFKKFVYTYHPEPTARPHTPNVLAVQIDK